MCGISDVDEMKRQDNNNVSSWRYLEKWKHKSHLMCVNLIACRPSIFNHEKSWKSRKNLRRACLKPSEILEKTHKIFRNIWNLWNL